MSYDDELKSNKYSTPKRCAKALKKYMPNMHLAVIYAKPRGLPLAGTYVEAITQDTWPVFPWDEEDKNNR